MSIADDANAPVHFKGNAYQPLTMADIGELIESLPAKLVPRQLLPFITVSEALKYGRSPFGLPVLVGIIDAKGGTKASDLPPGDQLMLAGALTDRFYGFDPLIDGEDDDDAEPPEPFQEGPAS